MDYIHEIGKRAKSVSAQVQHLSQNQKNEGLRRVAEELENQKSYLMAENEKDIEKAEKDGMKASLIDRLRLTEERIAGMAEGLRQIADLEDQLVQHCGKRSDRMVFVLEKEWFHLGWSESFMNRART